MRAGMVIAAALSMSAFSAWAASEPSVRSTPDVGVEAQADIGRPMVLRERVMTAQSVRLLEEVRSERMGLGVQIRLIPGVYALDKVTKEGRYYRAPMGIGLRSLMVTERSQGGIFIPDDPAQPLRAYQAAPLGNATALAPDMKIETASQSGFRRELIYSGVAQGVLSLSYREFVNDFSRPAYSQDLRYDLSAGREIAFGGARIEVLDASNTTIKFKLLSQLDDLASQPAAR